MKKSFLLLFVIALQSGLWAEEQIETQEELTAEQVEATQEDVWDDGDFLDQVAEDVEDVKHEKHNVAVTPQLALVALWYLCIVNPYNKVKNAFYNFFWPRKEDDQSSEA